MKNYFFFILMALAMSFTAKADFIQLTSGQIFEGDVVWIGKCSVEFETTAGTFLIPGEDLQCVNLDKPTRRQSRQLAQMFEGDDACFSGSLAGEQHGHGGGHFCAGFFGSLLGVALVYIIDDRQPSKSKNMVMIMDDKNLWSDPSYLNCYQETAGKKATKMAAIGFLTSLVLAII